MNGFNLYEVHKDYFTPGIISRITKLYQLKGRQNMFAETKESSINAMTAIAEQQGTESSCRLDGIPIPLSRLMQLSAGKSEPRNYNEEEIYGCLLTIRSINRNYDYIPCKTYYILQLHRELFSFSRIKNGGQYRKDPDSDCEKKLDELFDSFESAFENSDAEPLILIPMLILNFLKLQPFTFGNGRMARLLANLCLLKNGFSIARYVSLEKLMEDLMDEFHEAMEDSSTAWHDNIDFYEPFIFWFLEILNKAYEEFEKRTKHLKAKKKQKPELIEDYINIKSGPVTKKDIMDFFPEISEITVERTLFSLCRQGKIKKMGASRGTFYEKT